MRTKNLFGIQVLFFCAFCFMSCLKEDEEGRKITDYKEYVVTVASEMKPGVIWSEGNVNGSMMGWSFLDEEGNETNYPSFYVFVGRSAKSKFVDLMSNTVYLYKDFTEHYKNKYPEAGVKTIVVSYIVGIN
jgi:hypothetical protein